MRIACLHTAQSNVAVFDAALSELAVDQVVLRHAVRADLLADAERAGGLTPKIAERTGQALDLLSAGADVVLLTCSTLGPTVERFVGAPVLRVDAALAHAAVRGGGTVVALVAVQTSLEPTRALFGSAAAAAGAKVEVRLVPGAWEAFKAGDSDGYLATIGAAARAALAGGADRVALAQASMAGAAKQFGERVLTSPVAGLAAAIAFAETQSPNR